MHPFNIDVKIFLLILNLISNSILSAISIKYPNCFIISLHNNCNNNFFSSVDPVKKSCSSFDITSQRHRTEEKKKKKEANSDDQSGYSTQGYRKGRWTGNRNACPNSHVATFQNSRRGREGIECTPLRSRSVTFSTLTSAKHISAHFAVREWMAQIKKRFLKFSDK